MLALNDLRPTLEEALAHTSFPPAPHGVRMQALKSLASATPDRLHFSLEAAETLALAATLLLNNWEELVQSSWEEAAMIASLRLGGPEPKRPTLSRWEAQYKLWPKVQAILVEGQVKRRLTKTLPALRFLLQDMQEADLRLILAFIREAKLLPPERFFPGLEALILVWHLLKAREKLG